MERRTILKGGAAVIASALLPISTNHAGEAQMRSFLMANVQRAASEEHEVFRSVDLRQALKDVAEFDSGDGIFRHVARKFPAGLPDQLDEATYGFRSRARSVVYLDSRIELYPDSVRLKELRAKMMSELDEFYDEELGQIWKRHVSIG